MMRARPSSKAIHLFCLLFFLFGIVGVQPIHQRFHHHRPLLADTGCRSSQSHQKTACLERHKACPICEILASFQLIANGLPNRELSCPPPSRFVRKLLLGVLQTSCLHVFEARAPPFVRP